MNDARYWKRSWSPVVGCSPCSPGCAHCWAAKLAATRLAHLPSYRGLATPDCGWTGEMRVVHDCTRAPSCDGMLFACIMTDLFHADVGDETIATVLMALEQTSATTIPIVCTKRPERMCRMMEAHDKRPDWALRLTKIRCGVTVEDQAHAEARIPALLDTPSAGPWLSCEPLLGPVDLTPWLSGIDWVVVGGESGPGARRCDGDWMRSVVRQCQRAGVPVWVKQLGACYTDALRGVASRSVLVPVEAGAPRRLRHASGADMIEWPAELRVRERAW